MQCRSCGERPLMVEVEVTFADGSVKGRSEDRSLSVGKKI